MKRHLLNLLIFVLFLLPFHLFSQSTISPERDITGLWKGALYNDTTEKYLPYEIAISEENGKLSGYSYTMFDIDGKKEIGVKRIKIRRKNDQLTIEDVTLVSNDYSEPPPRKVRQQSVVNLLVVDTVMQLNGKWSTNQTREYRPLTGSIKLQLAMDYRPEVLFKKLVELKLDGELSFAKPEKKPVPDIAVKEKIIPPISLPVAVPIQSADADKPKEIAAIVPEKKLEILPENEPVATAGKQPVAQAEKSVVEKTTITTIIKTDKKITAAITPNAPLLKDIAPPGQPLVKTPAVEKVKGVALSVKEKKLTDLVKKDTASIKNKPAFDLAKKAIDTPAAILITVTEKKKDVEVASINNKKGNGQPAVTSPAPVIPPPVVRKTEPIAVLKEPVKKEIKPVAGNVKNVVITDKLKVITAPVANNKPIAVTTIKDPVKTESAPNAMAINTPAPKKEILPAVTALKVPVAAEKVAERKTNKEQSVFFDSDSLLLTLYDNGEVDGDTVSVLMNGQIIFAKQGLSTRANSKTIYIDKGMQDSLSLVMYAENLGSIPPNTGLLVIMDGQKRYEVRFSADLKTNSAILLRRRKQ